MAFRGYLCTTPSHIPSRLKLRCICSSFAGDLWKGVLTIDACYFPQKLRACPLPTEMTNMGFNKSYDSCVPKKLNGTNRSRAALRSSRCLLYLGVFTVYSICFQSFGNILYDRWSGHTTVRVHHGRFGMWALFWWVYKTWQVNTLLKMLNKSESVLDCASRRRRIRVLLTLFVTGKFYIVSQT